MSNKSQKLKELAMQAHIDNELDKSSGNNNLHRNTVTLHTVHPATPQHRNTSDDVGISNTGVSDNTEGANIPNTETTQNFKIKKTVYLDCDLHNIIKFIKFSQKIEETKFINMAIENQLKATLGENWRAEYKQYLKNN
jgi:hypothetical protein